MRRILSKVKRLPSQLHNFYFLARIVCTFRFTLLVSHHIYHTEAFILGGRNSGEADRMVFALTPSLGLLHVHARGVRLARSKLRHSLYDFAHADISLVKGREIWRVTGARELSRKESLFASLEHTALYARIGALIRRLVVGEEADPKLFAEMKNLHAVLSSGAEIDLVPLETLLVLRVLGTLGYMNENPFVSDLGIAEELSVDAVKKVESNHMTALALVNRSLAELHL